MPVAKFLKCNASEFQSRVKELNVDVRKVVGLYLHEENGSLIFVLEDKNEDKIVPNCFLENNML